MTKELLQSFIEKELGEHWSVYQINSLTNFINLHDKKNKQEDTRLMTREEARLYMGLLDIAFHDGEGSAAAYKLGLKLRDKYFPHMYEHLFEDL